MGLRLEWVSMGLLTSRLKLQDPWRHLFYHYFRMKSFNLIMHETRWINKNNITKVVLHESCKAQLCSTTSDLRTGKSCRDGNWGELSNKDVFCLWLSWIACKLPSFQNQATSKLFSKELSLPLRVLGNLISVKFLNLSKASQKSTWKHRRIQAMSNQ